MKKFWLIIIIVVSLVLLIYLAAPLAIISYHNLHSHGFPHLRRIYSPSLSDVNLIQSWMTYNYVNRIFGLPADYLKTGLNIADKRYPNLTIKTNLEKVKSAVIQYLGQGKPQ